MTGEKEKITLSCFSTNIHALELYKKIGFEVVGTKKKQFYMNSQYYDEVVMEMWIDEDFVDSSDEKK